MADYWSTMYDAYKYMASNPSALATATAINNSVSSATTPTTESAAAVEQESVLDQAARAAAMGQKRGMTSNILFGAGGFEEAANATSKILLGM